ncbi:MAG: flagellar motor protein MotB [Aliishimia sp.]
MAASGDLAPIIIKKKKVVAGGGHHGGAWKVAYADFVTAMMAFFMLMWLLNATTEKQKKGIADYFAPTIAISRVSGGGDGSFGGDSVFSENTLPQNGTGATSQRPAQGDKAQGLAGEDGKSDAEQEQFIEMEKAMMGRGGESMVEENALEHIVTRVTDEGLVIEIFDLPNAMLFKPDTTEPTDILISLARLIHEVSKTATNPIAVEGHVAAQPIVVAQSEVWEMSSSRAHAVRKIFAGSGMPTKRIQRITGHADREHASKDPMSVRNNRIEVILLREQ